MRKPRIIICISAIIAATHLPSILVAQDGHDHAGETKPSPAAKADAHDGHDHADHDHAGETKPSPAAKADAHDGHDHADHDHTGETKPPPATKADAHDGHDHADHDHAGETKPPPAAKADAHDGHDHASEKKTSTRDPAGAQDGHDHEEHADEVSLMPEAIKQYGVVVGKATKVPLQAMFTAPARAAFNTDAMAHVGSSVTGRASELKVKPGDVVKKGDLLIVVDSPELGEAQSDYLLKRTAVEIANPAVQLSQSAYDRAKQLLDQSGGIALAEVQKREAEWRTAEANLRAAEATATAAENKLHLYGMTQKDVTRLAETREIVPRYQVVAPISGQVIGREVTLGELVRPDRDALLVIADLSTVWVIADVPESRIGDVAVGSPARVKIAALRNRVLEGRITYIAPALDPNTRSAKVRIEVADDTGTIRPGMFAQATLAPSKADGVENVLAIPEEAVQTIEGGPAVFVPVEGEPNTFAKQAVQVGPVIGKMVQVYSGLKEGSEVVIAGSFILKAEIGKAGASHQH